MNTLPYTAWTFGTKGCQVRQVEIVEVSPSGKWQMDKHGNGYRLNQLYDTERQAVAAASAYLDRKQAEIDKLQRLVDQRRVLVKQQLRVCV